MTSHSWRDPHIIRTGKSFLKALYVTLGVFLFLFVSFHIGGALYVSSIETKSSNAFQSGIVHDLAYLKEQGDAVAQNDLIQEYLIAQDSEKLIDILQKEKEMRSIGLMGVANAQGVVVGRTLSPEILGDNVFLTAPAGRVVAQGTSVQSIELTGFFNQLFLTTARPIMHNEQMIGALFANYLVDDTYAANFRDRYLSKGVEVLFYTKEYGVYGSSFPDTQIRTLVNSYFNTGSEWIQNGSSDKTISFHSGTFYLVKNIVFPGLEQSPGGVLLFIPRNDISRIANSIIAFLTLAVFLFFALLYHLRTRKEERGWRYFCLLFLASLPVLGLTYFVISSKNIGFLELKKIPYPLYNSMIHLHPEFGIFDVDSEQHFSITVHPGDEAVNAVQIGLNFDPKMVEVEKLDITNSSCSYVIENTVDVKKGRADLSCVILDSGKEKSSILIADVIAVPKSVGMFTISFDTIDTKVLANDGLGTNVLRMSQSGTYQADNFELSSLENTSAKSSNYPLVIFSPTNPNQGRWYNNRKARFVWRGDPDTVYSYAFDRSAETVPSDIQTTTGSAVELSIPWDGIFYFHLRRTSGGPIAHYRLQSDRTPPSIISIRLSAQSITVGDVVRFDFEAEDLGSGIQKNYYVDLSNHLFLPTGSQLFVPFLEVGDHKVVLRVYDDAGNYSEKSQVINVEKLK